MVERQTKTNQDHLKPNMTVNKRQTGKKNRNSHVSSAVLVGVAAVVVWQWRCLVTTITSRHQQQVPALPRPPPLEPGRGGGISPSGPLLSVPA